MTREEKIQRILGKSAYDTQDLLTIVELLRAPGGCPWDREQTHESMRNDLIEETYEAVEAIDKKDPALLCEELGDVLLLVAMHARIEEESGRGGFDKITDGICRKLIHRHPHVFGETSVNSADEVLRNWEKIKSEEKGRADVTAKLRAVPRQYPALMRALKVGKKAGMMDFPNADSVLDKIREETEEAKAALVASDGDALFEEVGDLLLSVASFARKAGVDPERALSVAVDKFIDRFALVEETLRAEGLSFEDVDDEKKEEIWQKIKKNHKI